MLKILFIGTQNNYRSKFAQLYFNSVANEQRMSAISFSAGFNLLRKNHNVDTEVIDFLEDENIVYEASQTEAQILNRYILENNHKLICMDMQEHLTFMRKEYPDFVRQCTYWHFPTNLNQHPRFLFNQMRKEIDHLIASLKLLEEVQV